MNEQLRELKVLLCSIRASLYRAANNMELADDILKEIAEHADISNKPEIHAPECVCDKCVGLIEK